MDPLIKPRRMLGAMAVALLAGAGTAVIASGAAAPEHVITLRGADQQILTVRGSDFGDAITIAGRAGGGQMLTIIGDSVIENQRTDCTTSPTTMTEAYCNGVDTKKIDIALADGRDNLDFAEGAGGGITIEGRGAAGADEFNGSTDPDHFDGGPGGATLRGKRGDDELDGGAGNDRCAGGPGKDKIRNCEQ